MRALPANLAPMKESERPAHHPARASGFSLVEVLVTLLITALASALIVATARPSDPLKTEGERLTRALEQMQSQARISGTPMGMVLEPNGYAIVAWREGTWSTVGSQKHALASGVSIRWALPSSKAGPAAAETQLSPDLIIDPLGHSTVEPIVLETKGREVSISPPTGSADRAP
jgi:type II secretion system protein H